VSEYIPVPVAAAKEIAEKHAKDLVVVISYDRAHDLLHTTTFGTDAQSKDIAAQWGDAIPKLLGCAVEASKWYEDYRATEAATYKERIDQLTEILGECASELEHFNPALAKRAYESRNAALSVQPRSTDAPQPSEKTGANPR
jgi:hypothetical protein